MGFQIRSLPRDVLPWGFKYVDCLEMYCHGFQICRLSRDVLPYGFKYVDCLEMYRHGV